MHQWIPTGTGYELTVRDGSVVARNARGRVLVTVPPKARRTEAYDTLTALLDLLRTHDAEAGDQVERWLLRSLLVPRALLTQVWVDEAWRSWLTDLVVLTDDGRSGFLRAVDEKGLGVLDLDGESLVLTADQVLIAHPALLPDLDDLRAFAVELGLTQRLDQLFREVHHRPSPPPDRQVVSLSTWSGGAFDHWHLAVELARSEGFRVLGNHVITTVWEAGRKVEARYWIGTDRQTCTTRTGDLHWQSGGTVLPVAEVGPVAYSEGARMASIVYAGRTLKEGPGE